MLFSFWKRTQKLENDSWHPSTWRPGSPNIMYIYHICNTKVVIPSLHSPVFKLVNPGSSQTGHFYIYIFTYKLHIESIFKTKLFIKIESNSNFTYPIVGINPRDRYPSYLTSSCSTLSYYGCGSSQKQRHKLASCRRQTSS